MHFFFKNNLFSIARARRGCVVGASKDRPPEVHYVLRGPGGMATWGFVIPSTRIANVHAGLDVRRGECLKHP